MANFLNKVKEFFGKVWAKITPPIVKVWNIVKGAIIKAWNVVFPPVANVVMICVNAVKFAFGKVADLFKKITKNVKWKEVWDKCTTAFLIFLMFSPLLILGYIFLWFVFR